MNSIINKVVLIIVLLALTFTVSSVQNDVYIYAATDSTAPVCTGYKILNEEAITKPGKLELELSFEEEGTGINYFMVGAVCIDSNGGRTQYLCEFYQLSAWGNSDKTGTWYVSNSDFEVKELPKRPLYSETVKVNCNIPDEYSTGNWYINWIDVSDMAKNRSGCAPSSDVEIRAEDIGSQVIFKTTDSIRGQTGGDMEPSFSANPWFTLADEFNFQFEDNISNPNLTKHISGLNEGEAGKILLEGSADTTLPKEAFDAIRGKDIILVVYDKNYQWIINGKDLVNASKDVDLNTSISIVDWIEYGTYDDSCIIEFENNGTLPGKIEIRIRSDYMYNVYNKRNGLYLYYMNKDNAEIQNNANTGIKEVNDEKWCKFDVDHNSKYLLTGTKVGTKEKKITPTVKLSASSYTYSGKERTPSVTVKYGSKTFENKKDYSVKYASSRKNVGKYSVKVTMKGDYNGSKTVYFKINPKGVSISKLTNGKKAITVKWKKPSSKYRKQMTGYQIKYSTSKKMSKAKTVTVKSVKATSKTIKKLKAKKYYYVQLRTYKTVKGDKYYSSWSKIKKVKTK